MLHDFLLRERAEILALCKTKLLHVSANRGSSDEMEVGLPVFYDELIEVLRADDQESREVADSKSENIHYDSAMRRGRESLKLGYTISQVVHGYGALCQSITEHAGQSSEFIIAREFNRLNFCLDVAIAQAVTEFNNEQRNSSNREELLRLGYLAHEMRNALSHAAMAHQMIKKGVVGVGGSTNMVLETSLRRMKDIIDRSLAEVRLRGEPTLDSKRYRVIDMISEVEATASLEAGDKSIKIHVEVSQDLIVLVDRHLIVSAISNIVQNAIKFTKPSGNVWIRGVAEGNRILIEVEDQCGGLPQGKIEELFKPFSQQSINKSGIGLGLPISRSAVALCDGQLYARDIPGRGCIFTIDLPRIPTLPGEAEGIPIPVH